LQKKVNNLVIGKLNGRKSLKTLSLIACFFTKKFVIKQQESTPVAAPLNRLLKSMPPLIKLKRGLINIWRRKDSRSRGIIS